ncbi:MAG TPA: response regulator [Puia sp.]|uniref:hybrid sensor histidine kinase/response regulator n=1 Tax=Puia sp. TaxID=2045100 RepID=UPI002C73C6AC|nr:response regulator [Puia sp.]HVU98250.1 response regulator [Puia sp.]
MALPLKILHLEDLPSDAELVDRVLRKAKIEFEKKVVVDRPEFVQALREFQPDIILSDHSLPAFNSLEALRITKEEGITAPLILVTATVSEEYAVNVMQEGASDYILKDRLERLPNAVRNAMDRKKIEEAGRRADDALRSSEQKYKLLFEANPMPMWMFSKCSMRIVDVNSAAIEHYGYSREEFLSLPAESLWNPAAAGVYQSGIWKQQTRNGSVIDVEVIAHELVHDQEPVILVLAIDITEKLRAQAELARQAETQRKLITQTSIQVQEREREEIGKELHDNINQILAATRLHLDLAIQECSEEAVTEVLVRSYKNLSVAMEEIRQLTQSLVAPTLGGVSLDRALARLIGDLPATSSLRLSLDTSGYRGDIDDEDLKLTCYRIAQVQLSNIIKHSRAKNAAIGLRKTDSLVLTITDDGVGFHPGAKTSGIGLRNIRNRVGYYNGSVDIDSEPGKGCRLTITIPFGR